MSDASASLARFPRVTARSLAGREVPLPGGLPGERNLVVVAFERAQQEAAESWVHAGEAALRDHPDLGVVELPTIRRMNPVSRWMVAAGMRSGIPDRAARERTLTLHLDKARFRRALGIADEDRVRALLLDRDGLVRWRWTGRATPEAVESLRRALGGARATGAGDPQTS